ncbi:hypothetical protein C8R45DRAFT_323743 [Mycena sanguinolenta]|nr:hypothetical protein C8R45DRAFT_323743 [Mycena sanguinolenta]
MKREVRRAGPRTDSSVRKKERRESERKDGVVRAARRSKREGTASRSRTRIMRSRRAMRRESCRGEKSRRKDKSTLLVSARRMRPSPTHSRFEKEKKDAYEKQTERTKERVAFVVVVSVFISALIVFIVVVDAITSSPSCVSSALVAAALLS